MIPRSLSMFTLVTLIYIGLAASFALAQTPASPPAAPAVVPSQIQALPAATAAPAAAIPAAAAPADPFGAPPPATAANAAAPAAANPFGQPANAAPAAPAPPIAPAGAAPPPAEALPASPQSPPAILEKPVAAGNDIGTSAVAATVATTSQSAVTTATANTEVAVADTGTSSTAAADLTSGTANAPLKFHDFVGFWYSREETADGKVSYIRKQYTYEEFQNKKSQELDMWRNRFTEWMNGNLEFAADEGISREKASRLIMMDPASTQRVTQDPAFKEEMINRMAEWTLFFEQLEYWNSYVGKDVLAEDLRTDEKPSYDPAEVDTNIAQIYEKLKKHALDISDREYKTYKKVVKGVQDEKRKLDNYQEWVDQREENLLNFADDWGHRYDGSEVTIGKTLYLVRNKDEKAGAINLAAKATTETLETASGDKPTTETIEKMQQDEYIPKNAVVVTVPKERIVTPFDLIDKSGKMKEPK